MNKKDLRKLQQKWYKKLKSNGFDDIETLYRNGETQLKQYDSNQLRHSYRTSNEIMATQRYYELARQFYNDHVFETSREKEIWRLHSEGEIISKIADAVSISWSSVQRVTSRLARVMLSQRVGALDD